MVCADSQVLYYKYHWSIVADYNIEMDSKLCKQKDKSCAFNCSLFYDGNSLWCSATFASSLHIGAYPTTCGRCTLHLNKCGLCYGIKSRRDCTYVYHRGANNHSPIDSDRRFGYYDNNEFLCPVFHGWHRIVFSIFTEEYDSVKFRITEICVDKCFRVYFRDRDNWSYFHMA